MPLKRYESYFQGYKLVSLNNYTSTSVEFILTHSVGLIKCLIWCNECNVHPTIIAMDPPSIDSAYVDKKINISHDLVLRGIYERFKKLNIDASVYNITVFRPESKTHYVDSQLYKEIIYYNQDTHYPYMIKSVRNKVLSLINKFLEKNDWN